MLLEFPKCDKIKVNVEENKALLCQKNVKDIIKKQIPIGKYTYQNKGNCKSVHYSVNKKAIFLKF